MQSPATLDDFLKDNASMTANERRLVCAAWMAATNAIGRPTPLALGGADCADPECGGTVEITATCKTCGITRAASKPLGGS